MSNTIESVRARHENAGKRFREMTPGERGLYTDLSLALAALDESVPKHTAWDALTKTPPAVQKELDKLQDSESVLVNMLRGNMAKVSASSLYKLYNEDELLDAARAAAQS